MCGGGTGREQVIWDDRFSCGLFHADSPTLRTRIWILRSALTVLPDGSQARSEGCRDWLYVRASEGCGVAGASGN